MSGIKSLIIYMCTLLHYGSLSQCESNERQLCSEIAICVECFIPIGLFQKCWDI